MIYSLIDQLETKGVVFSLDDISHLKANLPWPVNKIPSEVLPLLQKVKACRPEIEKALIRDKSISVFKRALERIGRSYNSMEILPWCERHRPELIKELLDSEKAYNVAHDEGNMIDVQQAADRFERAALTIASSWKEARHEIYRDSINEI